MDKLNKELDPCPFCGGTAELVDITSLISDEGRCFVRCTSCGIEQGFAYSLEEAIEHWNTRSEYNGKKDN